MIIKFHKLAIVLTAFMFFSHTDVGLAQDNPAVGAVTNLPLPRYVSLKRDEANVRRGPSQSHRIDWVFMRRGTPLQITAEFEHWRRVRDEDGAGGWVHYSLLSGVRTVVIRDTRISFHENPDENSTVIALAEKGVIARLISCEISWCKVSSDSYDGWVKKSQIWGVGAAEIVQE